MRSIWGYALVNFLSLVYASLDGLNIYLALVSASLLEVDRRGGLSSHNVHTRLLARLTYSH